MSIRTKKWLWAVAGALLTFAAPLSADEQGEKTLREAFKTLHAAKTYTANLAINVNLPTGPLSLTGTIAAMKPNFLSVELKGSRPMRFVADGKDYHVQIGERYQKQALEAAPTAFSGQWEGEIDAFFGGEKILPAREITLAGTEKVDGVDCDLVKVAGNERTAPLVYAVGKTDHLIRRCTMTLTGPDGMSITHTNTLTGIKLNVPKDAKDFTFTAPAAAPKTDSVE